jgi:hypothetical protein
MARGRSRRLLSERDREPCNSHCTPTRADATRSQDRSDRKGPSALRLEIWPAPSEKPEMLLHGM